MFPYKFRFRTTVEVDTPQGLRSGSGVMEISAAMATFKLPESHAVSFRFKGEAIAVDLPGGTLFMLVGNSPKARPFDGNAIDSFADGHPREKALVNLVAELGEHKSLGRTVELNPEYYPKFVRFVDDRDVRTIKVVVPTELDKHFGNNVKLKRIILAVSDGSDNKRYH